MLPLPISKYMRQILTLAFVSFFSVLNAAHQKHLFNQQQIWYDFTETIKVRPRWSVIVNLTERHSFHPLFQSQFAARTYFLYHFKSGWSTGTGYAQFTTWSGKQPVPEFRPEQWIFYRQNFERLKILTLTHRFKIEERFTRNFLGEKLLSGVTFTMRFRYRIGSDITLFTTGKNKNPFKLLINEEAMLHAGKNIVYNIFDQNRITAGLSYQPVEGTTFSVNYMHLFRQKRTGYEFDNIHTLRIGIEHEFSVKAKQKNPQP